MAHISISAVKQITVRQSKGCLFVDFETIGDPISVTAIGIARDKRWKSPIPIINLDHEDKKDDSESSGS